MGNSGGGWRKWRVLAWYWLAQTAVLCIAPAAWVAHVGRVDGPKGRALGGFDGEDFTRAVNEGEYWVLVGVLSGAMIALQAVMLLPVRKPRARAERGWPLWLSAAVSAVGATALLAGLALLVISVGRLLELQAFLESLPPWWGEMIGWIVLGAVLASWTAWTVLIAAFMRRRLARGDSHEGVLHRVSRLLLKGTAIEAIAVIPVDVMIRRKTDCYSTEGTAWTLTLCFSVGLLALGPAIVVPLLARRRKDFYAGKCELCLYDVRELIASGREIDRCPECGGGWKAGPAGAGPQQSAP